MAPASTGVFLLIYFIGHVIETITLVDGKMPERHVGTDADWGHLFLIYSYGTMLSTPPMAFDCYLPKQVED